MAKPAKPDLHQGPLKVSFEGHDFTAKVGPVTLEGHYTHSHTTGAITGLTIEHVESKAQPKAHLSVTDDAFTFHAGPVKASGDINPDGTGTFDASVGPVLLDGEFAATFNEDFELVAVSGDVLNIEFRNPNTSYEGPRIAFDLEF